MERKDIIYLAGLIITALVSYYAATRTKKIEGEGTFQSDLLKEWGRLTQTLANLNADITELNADLVSERISKADFQIQLERKNARITDFVELVNRMLEVKKCWNQGDEKQARQLLVLVERDRIRKG